VTVWLKLRTIILGFVLATGIAFAGIADEAETPETDQSDQDFSLDEAADNFVEDAGKVGDKAAEVGSDITEGAEDAYDSAKEAVQEATE
jgi:hypothetical protein